MPLASGTHLGPYEILSAIGAGGMGEVYRARDSKLGRDVAIKVLPEAFAHDAERMVRFQREAKVLASLNHPNIATIHGLEDSGATHALVMELVEGRHSLGGRPDVSHSQSSSNRRRSTGAVMRPREGRTTSPSAGGVSELP